jgi:aerobic C4-dicarboxylate transport protein
VGALDQDRMQRVLNGDSSPEEMRALYEVDEGPERPLGDLAAVQKVSA